MARQVVSGQDLSWSGGQVLVWRDTACLDGAGRVTAVVDRLVKASRVEAVTTRLGLAWRGWTRCGRLRLGGRGSAAPGWA